MNDLNIVPINASLVGVIVLLTSQIKKRFPAEYAVYIPGLLAIPFALLSIIVAQGAWPGLVKFICKWIVESFTLGAAASYAYKLYWDSAKAKVSKINNDNKG